MTDNSSISDDEMDDQVEGLARDLVQTISAAPAEQRERLLDMAVHLLRDEVDLTQQRVDGGSAPAGGVNPFAICIPLLLVGSVTWIVSPLITLLLFAAAAVVMAWGVVATLFGGREG